MDAAEEECEVDKNNFCNVYRWFWEVCSTKLLQTPITLGGPGSVVQVGKLIFFHSPKYILYDFAKLQDVDLSQ